ncbi:hypothetical protein [Ruegeria sp. HKCCD7221]|uniref:hypothetical protein n=1 Tax=Ruegeria sp. HKCCD7221 TaxID=2683009 RepID=UPI0014893B74|nr:hypothetical protein [Ruegeria sp. HKCCD7221]
MNSTSNTSELVERLRAAKDIPSRKHAIWFDIGDAELDTEKPEWLPVSLAIQELYGGTPGELMGEYARDLVVVCSELRSMFGQTPDEWTYPKNSVVSLSGALGRLMSGEAPLVAFLPSGPTPGAHGWVALRPEGDVLVDAFLTVEQQDRMDVCPECEGVFINPTGRRTFCSTRHKNTFIQRKNRTKS